MQNPQLSVLACKISVTWGKKNVLSVVVMDGHVVKASLPQQPFFSLPFQSCLIRLSCGAVTKLAEMFSADNVHVL